MKQIRQVFFIAAIAGLSVPAPSVAQWLEVKSPGGWRINDLVVEGPYVVAATNRGVFRSNDHGETWRTASSGFRNSIVTSLAARHGTLFAGTADGVYRSTDLGASWTVVSDGLPRPGPMDVVWPAVSVGDEIFIGTDEGVFKSDDGGEHWTTVNFGLPAHRYIDGLAVIGSTVFAATSDGLYRTENLGVDWMRVDLGLPGPTGLAAMAQLDDALFAGTDRGVYVSVDGGESWSQIELGVDAGEPWSFSAGEDTLCAMFEYVGFAISKQGEEWVAERSGDLERRCVRDLPPLQRPLLEAYRAGFNSSIDGATDGVVVDRETIDDSLEYLYEIGGHLYADTGDGLFRSTDDGGTWQALDADLPRTLAVNAFLTNEAGIFAGTDRGVFVSKDNGRSWTPASPGEIEVFDFAAKGSSLYAGTGEGVYVTQDDGHTWRKTGLALGRFTDVTSVVALDESIIALTTDGIFLSRDDGATWLRIESDQLGNYRWDEMEVAGQDLFLSRYSRLVRSSDSGTTWVDLSSELPEDGAVRELTAVGDRLFFVSEDGTAFRTDDGGSTWQPTAALPELDGYGVLAAVDDGLLANTPEGVFLSADGGASWTAHDSDPLWHAASAFSKVGPDLIAGTTQAGVFVNRAGSAPWTPSSDGLPRDSNWPGDGFLWAGRYLFAGTSDGVYRSADYGRSWSRDTSLKTDGPVVSSIAVVGEHVLLGTLRGVFESTDDGDSWQLMRPELAPWPGVENLRLVGSTLLADVDKFGTFFLVPGGEKWQRIEDDEPSEAPPVPDGMTALAVFGEAVFARTNDGPGLFVSSDGATDWARADAGLPSGSEVISVSLHRRDLHARTTDGHFVSVDGGASWVGIGSGPPEGTMVWDYTISEYQVFAHNADGEAWRRPR